MELYIDLNRQAYKKKHRVMFRIIAIVSLFLLVGWVIVGFIEGMSAFAGFYSVYLLFMSIFLIFLGFGKSPTDLFGKAYFKINEMGVIYKSNAFRNKIVQYNWNEVEDIKIRLFKVELKIKEKWILVNLEKFSDDNLKSVKAAFDEFQSKITPSNQILQSSVQ